jgi:hypothetical protein
MQSKRPGLGQMNWRLLSEGIHHQRKRLFTMQIIDFPADDKEIIQQAAALLVEGFREHWPDAWPDKRWRFFSFASE